MILNCATNTDFSFAILYQITIGLFCLEVNFVLGKIEANCENKHSVKNLDIGQNSKAKTSLNWQCIGVCDTFDRLVVILFS